jgi:hypothetical protein
MFYRQKWSNLSCPTKINVRKTSYFMGKRCMFVGSQQPAIFFCRKKIDFNKSMSLNPVA